jgi:hypothetical protein
MTILIYLTKENNNDEQDRALLDATKESVVEKCRETKYIFMSREKMQEKL